MFKLVVSDETMSNHHLLLWLEAPLQAWGHDSRFGRRDSLDFPTKSGVLGIIACARGVGGAERDWLAVMADQSMEVHAYVRKDQKGKGVPRLPLLRDFHMVGAGYDDQSPWQTLLTPKKSDGSKAVGGGVKMTYRYYVQDMAYAVLLTLPADQAEQIVSALQAPVWDLYLGRKNCVPTEFIYQGCFESIEVARETAADLANAKGRVSSFVVYDGDGDEFAGEVVSINDVPIQFGERKLYRDRRVTVATQ